jgi:hypothetical protein
MKSKQKLTINKLIANDIINYALDDAVCDNYNVSLNTYLEDFDDDSKKNILDNVDSITEDIEQNESVLDLVVEKEHGDIIFNMIFYWEKILNQVEHIVLDNAKLFNVNLDYNCVKEIAENIIDDDEFNDSIINHIKKYDNGKDLD